MYSFIHKTNRKKGLKMNKEQKEIIKRINQAYGKLRCLNNITWTSYREDLLEMNKKDEKDIEVVIGMTFTKFSFCY